MKVHRHISLILTLCFSVFLGHSLVPHHHHAEQVHVPLSSDCPIDHEDRLPPGDETDPDHHGHEHPLHCHAFNDVVFHKYNPVQVPEVSRDISKLFVALTIQAAPDLASENSAPFIQIKIPDKLLACKGALSPRAPPIHA